MTVPNQQNTAETPQQNEKEINFRKLEERYERQLAQERAEKERLAAELAQRNQRQEPEEEDDAEPYVDKKKLTKTLAKVSQNTQSEIQRAMEMAKAAAKEEVKQELWLENNPDFYEVLQHAEKFAHKSPKLAESILKMPEGFERQKLVYQNIKALGIDKPEQKPSSIQEKVDANRKSPYYQPSGVGSAPYSAQGDYSPAGQKLAHEKMQELKNRLRLG